ncbi:hypothetical protein [Kitasatospora aureofaciens]|uniref:hypothetical protein n=1 Tax=Kitasatospora aureofaciens TaxID=1894 RepID=UPI001C44692C|nr:hypothetical protein [Kitasatospora aureofaciens]MBV6696249.1 hypothetical protein [Kitasatospora aureofaciens]
MRRTALTIAVLALGLAAPVEAASPAGAIGPQVPVKGATTFCLTPAADQALKAQHVDLRATAPATLDTTGPTPCVSFPITSGAVALDLISGGAPLDGAIAFVRTTDGSRADFTHLFSNVTRRTVTAVARVNYGPAAEIDFLTYTVSTDHVRLGLDGIDAAGLPLNLAPAGAQTFRQALGTSPLAAGQQLFAGDGHVDLVRSVLAVPVGLTN